ncbi:zinc ribbon domain-containing protein [Haloprofundus salilacus]|uniref:zinc ribbon domain-containing protein n=1 Tax=Haloprofundus salilacus TaxID=2876190 RepID=UPI001CCA2C9A|nr:zinc ribbon domain-containing protein [Haloprofundus salilacus]
MVLDSSTPNFCANCGASLSAGASFCSQCGSGVSSSAGSGADTTLSPFRQRVHEYTVHGWEVEHDYGDRVVVKKRGFGSIPVHVLLFLFTGGVGNAVYAWYRYSPGASRAELRADGTERWVDGQSSSRSKFGVDLATAGGVVVGFFLVWAAAVAAVQGVLSGFVVASLVALVVGLFVIRRRSAATKRRSPTAFGRKRVVDTEPIDEGERCVVCGERARDGVTRTFADKTYLAWFPVKTHDEGSNSYCRRCAVDDSHADEGERELDELRESA